MRAQGSILVGLLWCLALLSVVVIGVLHTARMDSLVVKNYGDRIQAHYLALAGVERAKALLYHDFLTRRQTSKNHTGSLYDDSQNFNNITFDRGHYRVFRHDGDQLVYGISDEESRLNVNTASADELTNLDGLTHDMAAAIIDWRGAQDVTPGGAKADYYAGLAPPYQPRNGPLQTVRELLLVRGIDRGLLLGENNPGGSDDDPDAEGGWSANLTVDSTDKNVSASGKDRVNVQTADQTTLTSVRGISASIARAIIAYRGQKKLQSIADLLDVTAPQNSGQSASTNSDTSSQSGSSGSTVINDQLLMEIGDDVTATSDTDLAGLININTAGLKVLTCLPSVDPVLAQAIISYRQSSGFFANTAELLKLPGMTHDIFKQLVPLVTARSETFRIASEGKITSTGTWQRMQVIIHIAPHEIKTLSYREDL
jgi:DNA uptake protein ComE-like DNA-binding protein